MMDQREARSLTGWILVTGFVLASLGLAEGEPEKTGRRSGGSPAKPERIRRPRKKKPAA